MRRLCRRRALDALLLPPLGHVHWLALHAGRHALMLGAFEPDGSTVLRDLAAEEQVIEVTGLGVGQDVTAGFNGLLDTTRTLNRLWLGGLLGLCGGKRCHK